VQFQAHRFTILPPPLVPPVWTPSPAPSR